MQESFQSGTLTRANISRAKNEGSSEARCLREAPGGYQSIVAAFDFSLPCPGNACSFEPSLFHFSRTLKAPCYLLLPSLLSFVVLEPDEKEAKGVMQTCHVPVRTLVRGET